MKKLIALRKIRFEMYFQLNKHIVREKGKNITLQNLHLFYNAFVHTKNKAITWRDLEKKDEIAAPYS